MSLKARIRRLQAQIDWLKIDGRLRHGELQFKMLDMQKRIERRLRQNPDDERVQRMARAVGLDVPLPKPGLPLPPSEPSPRITHRLHESLL